MSVVSTSCVKTLGGLISSLALMLAFTSQPVCAYQVLWQRQTALGQMGRVLLSFNNTGFPEDWEAAAPVQDLGADLDGDGITDIVTWLSDGDFLHIYVINSLTGEIVFTHSFQDDGYCQVISYFDVDPNDNVTEVLVGTASTKLVISGRVSSTAPSPDLEPPAADLHPPVPNPASGNLSIPLSMTQQARVEMAIFDVAGRRVRTLIDTVVPAGVHSISWDGNSDAGRPVPAGTYFARVDVSGVRVTEKVILLR